MLTQFKSNETNCICQSKTTQDGMAKNWSSVHKNAWISIQRFVYICISSIFDISSLFLTSIRQGQKNLFFKDHQATPENETFTNWRGRGSM